MWLYRFTPSLTLLKTASMLFPLITTPAQTHTRILEGIEKLQEKSKNYKKSWSVQFWWYLCHLQENTDIDGIIHFAAYKAVGESVGQPLMYFENNLVSSSTCWNVYRVSIRILYSLLPVQYMVILTVYRLRSHTTQTYGISLRLHQTDGRADHQRISKANPAYVLLRYFNPVGAHPSIAIGELPIGKPANLVPAIANSYW